MPNRTARKKRKRDLIEAEKIIKSTSLLFIDADAQERWERLKADPDSAHLYRYAERWAKLIQYKMQKDRVVLGTAAKETALLAFEGPAAEQCHRGTIPLLLRSVWIYGGRLWSSENAIFYTRAKNDACAPRKKDPQLTKPTRQAGVFAYLKRFARPSHQPRN